MKETKEKKKYYKPVKDIYNELREATKLTPKEGIFSEDLEEALKQELFDLPEEKIEEPSTEFEHIPEPVKKKDGLWDYVLEDEIDFFDPKCSYELTGFRPVDEENGLDFDPEVFREAANTYDTTGCYTKFPAGSKPYADYWREQFKRCTEGYTVGKYRVTGDHYFFLNFYRMQTVMEGRTAGKGRSESFPGFLAKQYEFFHYVEMAEKLHKDVAILKARGIGLSEIVASLAVRPYTTNRGYRSLLTAADSTKLNPLKAKVWKQMNWLDMNTGGGMRHLRQKVNNDDKKRASQVSADGVEFGWGSEVEAVVADTSDKIRGDRTDRLIFEECGSNKHLAKSWIQGNALVELGGEHFGTRIALGTGGDDMALEGLTNLFSTPEAYNVFPYKNYDTEDDKPILSAFFIPAHKFSLKAEYLDNRGVTDSKRFKAFYEEQRKKFSGNDLMDYCAEHCFFHTEALFKQGDNMFDSVSIADRLGQLRIQKIGIKPQQVKMYWNHPDSKDNPRQKVKLVEDTANGKIFIYEPPKRDPDGNVYKNLYVAGIDAIDQGSGDSSGQKDVSDFCIVIKKRTFGSELPNYVAIYKDRPRDIVEAYENAMKLLVYYNCKAMLEHTKIGIIMYFRSKKKENLFMTRPKSTMSDIRRGNSNMLGVPATEIILKHGLELINQFLMECVYNVNIDMMLEQLLKYSWENKRKFDIVAAMIVAEIGDEDLMGFAPRIQNEVQKQWKDFGWFVDSYGRKRYGILPDNYGG